MIETGTGDLFDTKVDALVNTVNCVGVMGKGVALQFKRRYPEMYVAYKRACDRGEVRLGQMDVHETQQMTGPRLIINFPTKGHWKAKSRLNDIESGLDALLHVVDHYGVTSVALPPLGAGNGGLYWPDVRRLIEAKLGHLTIPIILFEPSGHSAYAVEGARAIRMTRTRALALQLIERYSERRILLEPWSEPHSASHLELQKLFYFAEVIDSSLDLRFSKGLYGPYSERVRHVIADMEGRYLRGYGDGTANVLSLDPIQVTDEGARELRRYLETDEGRGVADLVERVMTVTQGYESAYGVELLATALLCVSRTGFDADAVANEIQSWNPRKARLFERSHVGEAIEHLERVAT